MKLLDNGLPLALAATAVLAGVGLARQRGSFASTARTALRVLPYRFVDPTSEESKGFYHGPVVISFSQPGARKEARIVISAGTGDDVEVYGYGDNVLVVSSRPRMPYFGATLYAENDGVWRTDQDVFLQGYEEVVDGLGKRWESLVPRTIAQKLLSIMS